MEKCSVEDATGRCPNPTRGGARGWCQMHYMRWWTTGDVGPVKQLRVSTHNPVDQFWDKVEKGEPGQCWPWTGSVGAKGYGKAKFQGEWVSPHRFSYELHIGPIPPGLEIDHTCRNTGCVNPAHLEAVTPAENMRRRSEAVTHCKRGHEFTPENTKRHSKTGCKVCRTCQRDYQREWMQNYRSKTHM